MPAFGCTHAGEWTGHRGFVRLFERRQRPWSDGYLLAISATMDEERDPRRPQAVAPLPAAGFTYLGQFIDHDLTSDPRCFGAPPAGDGVENFSTPRFDLDSVYGTAPPAEDNGLYDGDRLSLSRSERDFLRGADDLALVADVRNDSNRILSQLHVAFVRFHNRVVDALPAGIGRLEAAKDIVRRHYQWIVLHEFLPAVAGSEIVQSVLGDPRGAEAALKFVAPGPHAQIPLEFSAAAFRFGHSMVRESYHLNPSSGLMLTFDRGQPGGDTAHDLRGFRPLPDALAIDWRMFFRFPDSGVEPQLARPIDTFLALPLFELPFKVASSQSTQGRQLPYRNLHRSEFDLGLPSGQQVARAMRCHQVPGAEVPLLGLDIPIVATGALVGDRNIGGTGIGKAQLEQQLTAEAPLWYYILKEAEQFHDGVRLGTVGGRLVTEVLIAMMLSDTNSIVHSGWQPEAGKFGCRQDGCYGIVDFLAFAAPG